MSHKEGMSILSCLNTWKYLTSCQEFKFLVPNVKKWPLVLGIYAWLLGVLNNGCLGSICQKHLTCFFKAAKCIILYI